MAMPLARQRQHWLFGSFVKAILSQPLFPRLAIPAALSINLPSLVPNIWESILRAVPKKKTSYSKKRSRLLAGKALKDVTALVKCPACGEPKRAHLLCTSCVDSVRKALWESATKMVEKTTKDAYKAANPPKPMQAFQKSWLSNFNAKPRRKAKKASVEAEGQDDAS